MMSRFTIIGKSVTGVIILIFISAYLFQSTMMALSGAALLLYLSYRRMEFHSLARRVGLEVERNILEEVMHKDSPCTVRLKITSGETVSVRVRENIHRTFLLREGVKKLQGTVRPERPLSLVYTVIPKERGYFRFPGINISLREARHLFETDIARDPETEIFVRASKKDIAMAKLMSRRKQFDITGPAHKRHTRTYRADFRTIREYMPGDRFRDIDWKAMSRLTKLMTKEFEQETNLPTMVMMDTSMTMREMIRNRSKIDHAIALALQIAVVMNSNSHPVGLISFDENKVIEHLSPGKCELDDLVLSLFKLPNPIQTGSYPGLPISRDHQGSDVEKGFLSRIGPFLVKGRRSSFSREKTTGIFEAMRSLEMTEESGMLIIIISDLETNRPSFIRSVQMALRRKHRVFLVSPFSWSYHLSEDEISVERIEKMYRDNLEKQTLLRSLRAGGVKVIDIGSGERGETVISGIRRMSK